MTKNVEYECNLCLESIPDDNAGVGIFWQGQAHGRNIIVFKHLANAERHMCNNCINDIITENKHGK